MIFAVSLLEDFALVVPPLSLLHAKTLNFFAAVTAGFRLALSNQAPHEHMAQLSVSRRARLLYTSSFMEPSAQCALSLLQQATLAQSHLCCTMG